MNTGSRPVGYAVGRHNSAGVGGVWRRRGARRCLFTGLLLLLLSGSAFAQGITGFGFLEFMEGARPAALGGGFVALADDINALRSNPAGLIQLPGRAAQAAGVAGLTDITCEFLSYAAPLGNDFAWGLSLYAAQYGSLELPDYGVISVGNDIALGISFSRGLGHLLDGLSIGGTVKALHESIVLDDPKGGGYSWTTPAFDVGFLYRDKARGIRLGACVQDLGGANGSQETPLPTRLLADPDAVLHFGDNRAANRAVRANGLLDFHFAARPRSRLRLPDPATGDRGCSSDTTNCQT